MKFFSIFILKAKRFSLIIALLVINSPFTYSQPDVPPVCELRNTEGELVETLEKADISRLEAQGWKPPTPFTVKSADER